MKKYLILVLALLVSALGIQPAHATGETLELTGFKTMQSTLSAAQKTQIRTYLDANAGATSVTCVGYTGYNYLGESAHKIQALAKARATAVCNYIHQRTGATITSTSGIRTKNKNGNIRKTIVTLAGMVAPGYYTYSLGDVDGGSEQHAAPTGQFLAGTTAATQFSDGTICMTNIADPYSGNYYATIFGGTAAYFASWNTAADGTGTTYLPGAVLPALPAGSHTVLYAIAATG